MNQKLFPFSRMSGLCVRILAVLLAAQFTGCGPETGQGPLPVADLTPPLVISAAPEGECTFCLTFSENVLPVEGTFFLEPGPEKATARVDGKRLELEFAGSFRPGANYRVAGEVEDARGNSTRFVFSFTGWNAHPAAMLISELQTGKNGSKTNPHRDFVELRVLGEGDLGGMELAWTSSVKTCRFVFPSAKVSPGDYIVVHAAPEGIPEEKDETGDATDDSGGTDSSPLGRDFWCTEGGLPDANGAVGLSQRPGGPVMDLLFYADGEKSGVMKDDKLSAFLAEFDDIAGIGKPSSWEDGFTWKPSSARSIARKGWPAAGTPAAMDKNAWYVGDSGTQSPGSENVPCSPGGSASARHTKSAGVSFTKLSAKIK